MKKRQVWKTITDHSEQVKSDRKRRKEKKERKKEKERKIGIRKTWAR